MIVWLASYPRSGNTLLRTILHRFFGVKSYSIYDDQVDIGADPNLAKLVGHVSHGMDHQKFVALARAEVIPVFVKTHGRPPDNDAKGIYLVRDGRAAIVSYFHYNKDILKLDVSLEQVVKGDVWARGWSENVQHWVFSNRPNTLVLKFEDVIARQAESLELIANFLALPILKPSSIEFSELHAAAPAFFRKGSNATNEAELDGNCAALFWSLHGDTMVRLGYVSAVPGLPGRG